MTDVIATCVNMAENCLGGPENFTCYEGHVGPLCESCDIYQTYWNESWSNAKPYVCG